MHERLRRAITCVCLPIAAATATLGGPADTGSGTFRAESSLVLIPVNVTDRSGRPVSNLKSEDFQLTEEGRPQKVTYFLKDEAPISIAIVVDFSKSMMNKTGAIREGVAHFLSTANGDDEFCLIELHDRAELVYGFGASTGEIESRLLLAKAEGQTALLDGIYLALRQMKKARFARKAVLVISDGGDNHSRFRAREVKAEALESDAAIYAAEPPGPTNVFSPEGSDLLEDLSEQTGGHDYQTDRYTQIADAAEKIGWELRSQYLLGYVPTDLAPDGKYHRLRVKVVAPGVFSASWRRGYYAPTE